MDGTVAMAENDPMRLCLPGTPSSVARHGLERATRRAGNAAAWVCLIALLVLGGCAPRSGTESEEPSRPQRLSVEEEIRGVPAAGPAPLAFTDTPGAHRPRARAL